MSSARILWTWLVLLLAFELVLELAASKIDHRLRTEYEEGRKVACRDGGGSLILHVSHIKPNVPINRQAPKLVQICDSFWILGRRAGARGISEPVLPGRIEDVVEQRVCVVQKRLDDNFFAAVPIWWEGGVLLLQGGNNMLFYRVAVFAGAVSLALAVPVPILVPDHTVAHAEYLAAMAGSSNSGEEGSSASGGGGGLGG